MTEDVQGALRESFGGLLGSLVKALTPGADGTMPKFDPRTASNFTEFLQLFSARNITDDAELAALVDKAKDLVVAQSPESLKRMRGNGAGATIRDNMTQVKTAVDTLISSIPKRRKFDFSE